MKIITGNLSVLDIEKSVLTVGNFDGIHLGHRFLINKVIERAKLRNAQAMILTFEPHTGSFITKDKTPNRLTTFSEKALILREFDIDYLICLSFNKEFAAIPPLDFIKNILIKQLKVVEWVMGANHTFGKGGKGTYNLLHNSDVKNHINVFAFDLHTEDTTVASSTKIRSLISQNQIDDAVVMLGHPYPILAERIRGVKKGFELGYPTLNFKCPPSQKVIPPPGIYAAEVEYNNNKLKGALYFGNCPTFKNRDYHFEFHSLEPIQMDPALNAEVALWLHSYIRPEESFSSEQLLVEQIKKDIHKIKLFFNKE